KDDFLAAKVFSPLEPLSDAQVFQHRFSMCLRSFPRHINRGGKIGGNQQIGEVKFRRLPVKEENTALASLAKTPNAKGQTPTASRRCQKIGSCSHWISIPEARRSEKCSQSDKAPGPARAVCGSCSDRLRLPAEEIDRSGCRRPGACCVRQR